MIMLIVFYIETIVLNIYTLHYTGFIVFSLLIPVGRSFRKVLFFKEYLKMDEIIADKMILNNAGV